MTEMESEDSPTEMELARAKMYQLKRAWGHAIVSWEELGVKTTRMATELRNATTDHKNAWDREEAMRASADRYEHEYLEAKEAYQRLGGMGYAYLTKGGSG